MEFLKYHELGTVGSQSPDALSQTAFVVGYVTGVVLLQHSYFQFFHIYLCYISSGMMGDDAYRQSTPSGSCMVRQWMEPCWRMMTRLSMPMSSWSGKAWCRASAAAWSLWGWS